MNAVTAQQQVALEPFDAIAPRYDEIFTLSSIGQAQRAAVWTELEKTFLPGNRVLEIGCGTGVDAAFLADRGVRVVATDSSAQMIEVTKQRIRERGLQDRVQSLTLRAEDIASLSAAERFDGAFSNFGALNCVEDISSLGSDLARLLKPGASALLCWMGPFCLWEALWYLGRADTEKAFRRRQRAGVTARIGDGVVVQIHYPSLKSLEAAFCPEFQLKSCKGIGITVPPSYLEPWAQRFPKLIAFCALADSFFGRCPGIRFLGDHILLRFERVL